MRVTVDDATIDVETAGDGSAILLLHGFPLSREIWNAQAEHLQKTARVIRLDLRGMGRSSSSDGPYLMEALAGDAAAVLDAMQVASVTLIGHSLGGYVAMAFARMYAERVTRMVLVCSRLAADAPATAREREELADRCERESSMEPALEAYLPRLLAAETRSRHPEIVARVAGIIRRNDPLGAAAMLRGMAQRAPSDDIAQDLQMPVLVIGGSRDAIVPPDEIASIAKTFPRGEAVQMERSGHLPMLEQPAELSEALALWWGANVG